MKEAKYWRKREGDKVQCELCPHGCLISPGKSGICGNKQNVDGVLIANDYGQAAALALDPIEKKPLYHFYPGSMILSYGGLGCNLACIFCQNYHLVTHAVPTEPVTPEDLVRTAKRENSIGLAYTYNEPFIHFEFVLDCARAFKEAGLVNVLVTNGFYNPEPFEELLPYIDAMNIDLKSIRDDFYKKYCKARLAPVQKTIERASRSCLVELTNLVVTNLNDSDEDFRDLVDYVASVSRDMPLHFSRYHPTYKAQEPPTPEKRLLRAYELAKEKLNYVYIGNLWTRTGQDSLCPHCRAVLVERHGFSARRKALQGNRCTSCGSELNFIS